MKDLIKIKERENIYNIPFDDLFTMGIRANNPKRNFLFISKLLGKHLIVKPQVVKMSGCLLSSLLYPNHPYNIRFLLEQLHSYNIDIKTEIKKSIKNKEKVLVIGFAETATGLGQAVASCIENSIYGTTTRDMILFDAETKEEVKNTFSFEESHSHATTHKCYLDETLFDVEHIILVDDEITTGNTMLHLIENLLPYTTCRKFSILSILDWRNDEYLREYETFQKEHSIELQVASLVSGEIEQIDNSVFEDSNFSVLDKTESLEKKDVTNYFSNKLCKTEVGLQKFLKFTGKFGCTFEDILKIEEEAKRFATENNFSNKKLLVIGHGENIYIPSRIADYLEADFKTTSRSPIYCSKEEDYPIQDRVSFYDGEVLYNFYNAKEIEKTYDLVLFLTEKPIDIQLTKNTIQYII